MNQLLDKHVLPASELEHLDLTTFAGAAKAVHHNLAANLQICVQDPAFRALSMMEQLTALLCLGIRAAGWPPDAAAELTCLITEELYDAQSFPGLTLEKAVQVLHDSIDKYAT